MPDQKLYIVLESEDGEAVGLYTHRIIMWERSLHGGTEFLLNNGDVLEVTNGFDDVCNVLGAIRCAHI